MSLNLISPRKSPRTTRSVQLPPPQTPPQWKKPEDIMRMHRLRVKKNALTARMNGVNVSPTTKTKDVAVETPPKRKNPFRKADAFNQPSPKKNKPEVLTPKEVENDDLLFKLLGINSSEKYFSQDLSFLALPTSTKPEPTADAPTYRKGARVLPVDWTMRTKIKFYSRKPFPWNQTLKLCEEASGITGFVRCIETKKDGCAGLDTSPNATFHECCLYWQHPNLPWLELFPRGKVGKGGDIAKVPFLTAYPYVKDSLHRDWSESFRALLQLLRARLCPYFYVMANSFNCVFRASGVNGSTQTIALVNPTTSGFRKLLAADGVNFTMPLNKSKKRISEEIGDDEEDMEESEMHAETSDWLASLGVDAEEIKKLNNAEMFTFKSNSKEEGKDESIIVVEGTEVHALFNFLINCKSIIATSGPLTGVPPTLLSPVAFTGGSLLSLKVRQSTVSVENESFHSIELRGPILPQAVHNLCNLLQTSVDDFSVTLANIDSTKIFTLASSHLLNESESENVTSPNKLGKGGTAFNVQSLDDCGLKSRTLNLFCDENLKLFDSIKYSDELYICS